MDPEGSSIDNILQKVSQYFGRAWTPFSNGSGSRLINLEHLGIKEIRYYSVSSSNAEPTIEVELTNGTKFKIRLARFPDGA